MLFPLLSRLASILLVGVALVSCTASTTPDERSGRLIGCWFGDDYQPVLRQSVPRLMEHKPDGTFKIEFRPKDRKTQIEEGTYRDQGAKYTTVTRKIDGKSVDLNNQLYTGEYDIKLVANGFMEIYDTRLKVTFKARKVECSPWVGQVSSAQHR